jgi:hypothetical protein
VTVTMLLPEAADSLAAAPELRVDSMSAGMAPPP